MKTSFAVTQRNLIKATLNYKEYLFSDNLKNILLLWRNKMVHWQEYNTVLIIILFFIHRKITQLRDGHSLPPSDNLIRFIMESTCEEFPSCANCDRNEKSPMFFCNTCGKFYIFCHCFMIFDRTLSFLHLHNVEVYSWPKAISGFHANFCDFITMQIIM